MARVAEDELGAAAAHVEEQHRLVAERIVRQHALKRPVRLLLTADDLDRHAAGRAHGREQSIRVHRVPGRAGGDDPEMRSALRAGGVGEVGDGLGSVGDGLGTEPVVIIEAPAQARLLAAFPDRLDASGGNVRDEQLHRVGADVYDSATLRTRSAEFGMRNGRGEVLRVGAHGTKH
jgi:hypothetical protein